MGLAELGAGVQAEFFGEVGAGAVVGEQGFGAPARVVERVDEERPEGFAEWVFDDQALEFTDHLGMVAAGQAGSEVILEYGQAGFAEAGQVGLGAAEERDVGQRITTPEIERAAEEFHGFGMPGLARRLPGKAHKILEDRQVQLTRPDHDEVSARPGLQPGHPTIHRGQNAADGRDLVAQIRHRR
ncbi:hypothetical protein SAMN05421504_11533 [Amycolatopsis xylanica]|uniref:Uncharacterized protein n=1 Tax=Amycolatopsis xylanica TaxID=589385 RepID=A0A1H3SQV0_9PSEU|nr:hypothetical protein SAMN05421504_11533 [Amycolatopsis xylanica]